MLDVWYKSAIIYSLNVATFMDGNGDGIGDFRGLAQRLDHIAKLGADPSFEPQGAGYRWFRVERR